MSIVVLDADGRIAIPEELRAELGLVEGQRVVLRLVGSRLVVEPAPGPARLVEKGGAFVLRGPGPPLDPGFNAAAADREVRDRAIASGPEGEAVRDLADGVPAVKDQE